MEPAESAAPAATPALSRLPPTLEAPIGPETFPPPKYSESPLPPSNNSELVVFSESTGPSGPSEPSGLSRAEVEALIADSAWKKGPFRIVPTGAIWGDAIYATQRTNAGAYTLYVYSDDDHPEDTYVIDIRRSRFALDLAGPGIDWLPMSQSSGRVEIDFHGNFVTENRAGVLLRYAFWEIRNDEWRLLFGQYDDVISPLLPGTINYSVGWNAGNIGFRRAQIRAERTWTPHDEFRFTAQSSINQDVVSDFPTEAGVRREASNWPVVEGRLATSWGGTHPTDRSFTLGVSAHAGETGFDFIASGPPPLNLPPEFNARYPTWSINADVRWIFAPGWGFQAEFYHGTNLGTFLGGIGQGVCGCVRVPIRDTGGWAELWHDWSPRWHSHLGFGVDDPKDSDSYVGRVYNQFLFTNVLFDLTDHWTTGLEVSWWKTLYHDTRVGQIPDALLTPRAPGESVVIDWMLRFGF